VPCTVEEEIHMHKKYPTLLSPLKVGNIVLKNRLIAMARAFVSDPDIGRKAYEGRGEDVVPCIRCNKCLVSSNADPYVNVCSVNPSWGLWHRVILLEMQDRLAPDTAPLHYYTMLMEACNRQKNLTYILKARCTEIGAERVTYVDGEGASHDIKAGSVVIAAGMKPRTAQAMLLSGAGNIFYLIGDCNMAGNVQKAMRSAFSIASMI
jgi:hypothetical protein